MEFPFKAQAVLLHDARGRDRTTARRMVLCDILAQERYLTRAQLIVRVEGQLGRDCFGSSAWQDTFYRDMTVVKQAFQAAGYQLAYSRTAGKRGYYLRNRSALGRALAAIIEGSIQEVDPQQIAVFKRHSPARRFQQGCSVSNLACQVVANRLRQKNPEMSLAAAQRQALQGRTNP